MDVEAERVAAERRGVGWCANDDGEHARPMGRRRELAVVVTPLIPGDAEAIGGRAHDILHIDRHLFVGEIGERVMAAGIPAMTAPPLAASGSCRA